MALLTAAHLRPLVLLGAGGHARVLLALARAVGHQLLGVCDPGLQVERGRRWDGLDVLGGDDALVQYEPDDVGLILGIGQLARSCSRARFYSAWCDRGFSFPPLVHPAAWVAPDVVLTDGVQIMAGAVLQPGCNLGRNIIINTRASVDHDCHIGANVHIAPGAILCGGVVIGADAFIGAGAVLIQGVHVGNGAVVGAGVTLTQNLPPYGIVVGAANRYRPSATDLTDSPMLYPFTTNADSPE